jgi:hypothetical protein
MLTPGRKAVNSPVRIAANFQDEDRTDIDPTTVSVKLMSPAGEVSTYVYNTDAALVRINTGDFYIDFTPNASGRWHYRWITTGTNKAIAFEGSFVVEYSHFEEGIMDAYRS